MVAPGQDPVLGVARVVRLLVHEAGVVGAMCDDHGFANKGHGVAFTLWKQGGIAQFYTLVLLKSRMTALGRLYGGFKGIVYYGRYYAW